MFTASLRNGKNSRREIMSKAINGHHSAAMKSDTYLTPLSIIRALGDFDLDPCTPEIMPWQTAKNMLNKTHNGLLAEWFGRVWLNPPYGREAVKWVSKLAAHNNGTALLLARTETKDWFTSVWPVASAILFMKGRIYFHDAMGERLPANCGAAPVLVSYGEADRDRLESCGIDGKFLPLNYTPVIVVGVTPSWFSVVSIAVRNTGSDSDLQPLYEYVSRMAPEKVAGNAHWKEKVRQQVQKYRLKIKQQEVHNGSENR